ncbi:IPT/TIG domain-containing protein (plasmid) [Streptomyces sp. NBC_01591]|uniref:IPT/TIG domain-containing protein n=1 Tax=Streptomyces sp. NBC_01591 TaxID=2975888 RepID=UPI002DDB3997|nr:IPT/TIG domain-containing protein [Streptomyces sp. NBC_01591]WSD74147.1 IPT/TIG domain-containing protein [Streptomyces sp. NBC_01591]
MVTLNPHQGPTSGGNQVVITGTNFTGATSVKFGTKSASFAVDSATQITAVAPSNNAAVQVIVTTPAGTSAPAWYYYISFPSKSSLSETMGPLDGIPITLTGSSLTTATSMSFGSNSVVPTVVNDTTLNVTVPPVTTPQTVGVSVTTIGGTTNGLTFTYVGAPTVTSMTPTTGPDYGGTASTIIGTNLSDVVDVSYGPDSTSYNVIDDTTIVAYSPGGTGTVPVTVTSTGGSDSSQTFTYTVSPG